MGWSSGSSLFGYIIDAVLKEVPDQETRKRIYQPIFDEFQNHDWDTEDECLGVDPAYDEIYREYFGDLEDDDYEDGEE